MARRHDTSWHETIDGWIRDPAIRRYSLTVLAMFLTAAILISSIAIAGLSAVTNSVPVSPYVKITKIFTTIFGASSISWLIRNRRRRRA